ncbi:MAG: DMT family transporter [Bacillota bacterium]
MIAEVEVSRKKMILADLSLLIVAVFWGSNFVVMKASLELIPPFTYLGLRFLAAAVLVAVVFWRKMRQVTSQDLLIGSLIGFFLFAGFGFQTIGLLYTTPAKSGFITGTAVVIVPFLYILVTRKSPGWLSFAGGFLAAVGLFLLSASETFGLEFGDALTFISAILFAAHIISLGIFAPRRDPLILAAVQMAFVGLANLSIALFVEPIAGMLAHPPIIWGAIFYAVFFCTIGAFVTQTVAQRFTLPTHAALILSTEAVFAGLFSLLFWEELFTLQKLAGALLIFTGIAVTELKPILAARAAKRQAEAPVSTAPNSEHL